MRNYVALTIGLGVVLFSNQAFPSALPFGVDYNLMVFGNFQATQADVRGRLLVQNDLTTVNWIGVGGDLPVLGPAPNNLRDDLIVGGNITLGSAMSSRGNVAHQGTQSGTIWFGPNAGLSQVANLTLEPATGNAVSTTGLAIGSLHEELKLNSTLWGGLPEQGVVESTLSYSTLTLTGNDPHLNVFHLDPGTYNIDGLTVFLEAPATSTVLINVPDANVHRVGGSMTLNGVPQEQVLVNLFNATDVTLANHTFHSSVLAAHAQTTTLSGGILYGQGAFGGNVSMPVTMTVFNVPAEFSLQCHRALQNQPLMGGSKPASLRC